VAVNGCVAPPCTLALVGVTVTTIAGGGGAVTVIVAAADFVVSVTEVAVNVTVAGEGTLPGAVYVMPVPDALEAADSVPQAAPLQPFPDSVHVTPLFCESFCTVAVNGCIAPVCTLALVGETVTTIPAGAAVTVIVAAADFVVSATDVAVNVTVAGEGTLAGAVYVMPVPDALEAADSVPQVVPLQPAPESDHVTPLFELSLVTVAVKVCPWLTCTDAVVGETLTAIEAPEGDVFSGVELDEQPYSNIAATIVMAQKHPETRFADARVTA
jgi:hypothetical protein